MACGVARDVARLDVGCRHLAVAQAAPDVSSAAAAARGLWRAGADRRLRASLVRGSWPTVLAAGVHRRCDRQVDAVALRAVGKCLHLFRGAGALSRATWRPVAFYSDKHSVFRVAKKEAKGGQGMTQFGRALCELNIEILCANSSQAKGRVERMNRTLQDRLVKELRLAGISNIEAGNAFLPGFMERLQCPICDRPCPARRPAPAAESGAGSVDGDPVQTRAALCRTAADVFV